MAENPEKTVVPAEKQSATIAQGWQASLTLGLSAESGNTRLARCTHTGPLYVQKPFYPEGREHPHLYLLHPPGGIVSGDCLDVRIDVAAGGGALLTTPGAARVYRARKSSPLQRQRCHLRLDTDATLEWFPMETIVFDGACVELETTVEMVRNSCFIGWELICFGLPASSQPFRRGRFSQRYRIMQDGTPVFIDCFCLDEDNRASMLDGAAGMGGHPVSGVFLAGPVATEQHTPLLQRLRQATPEPSVALSWLGDFLVGRYLGGSAWRARKLYATWWQSLRPSLLGRDACVPRIWST